MTNHTRLLTSDRQSGNVSGVVPNESLKIGRSQSTSFASLIGSPLASLTAALGISASWASFQSKDFLAYCAQALANADQQSEDACAIAFKVLIESD
jgi:hypothetical protein